MQELPELFNNFLENGYGRLAKTPANFIFRFVGRAAKAG